MGQPLTRPLSVLNKNCDFKKKYDEIEEFANPKIEEEVKAKKREYMRKYYQRPEIKAKQREHYQRPEIKAKQREYMRKYYQRPEIKAKQREYKRKKNNIPKSRWRVKK